MTEKEMKKLSRAELLELLLVQTQETELLREKLKKAESMLSDRNLRIQKAGDLAQAVLELNGVMAAAQAAAQQYLDNIEAMEKETRLKCEKMLADARSEAERIRQDGPAAAEEGDSAGELIAEIYDLLDDIIQ